MPSEWIESYHQTNETEIRDNEGVKIQDLISCEQGAGVEVNQLTYPELWDKLPKTLVGGKEILYTNNLNEFNNSVACSDDGTVIIIADSNQNTLQITTDSGDNWTTRQFDYQIDPDGVACSANGEFVYVVDGSKISLYSDYGATVVREQDFVAGSGDAVDVSVNSDNTVVMVIADVGEIRRSTNGAVTWTLLGSVGGDTNGHRLAFSDGLYGYVVGFGAAIKVTSDGGYTWTTSSATFPASLSDVACDRTGQFVAVTTGTNNQVFLSSDYGDNFTAFAAVADYCRGIAMTTGAEAIFVGTQNTNNLQKITEPLTVAYVPNMPRETGSPTPWKVVADAT